MDEIFNYIKNPKRVLDIGANIGEFSKKLHNIYKDCEFILIEPNINCEDYLKKLPFDYKIIGLSDKIKMMDFYVEAGNNIATGASLYKENTYFYRQGNYINYKINATTLDAMNFYSDNIIDLIKMDTQGSEYDIISGGTDTLKRTRYLFIEVSFMHYNQNAPLADVVHSKLKELGYKVEDILCYDKLTDGSIFQMDVLYKNTLLVSS
jgi:FkbM family methyltransferase